MRRTKSFVAAFALALLPCAASAQTFGVIALDAEARATELDAEVSVNLNNAGVGVVTGDELAQRLEEKQSAEPDDALLGRFAGLTTSIGNGVNEFFYSGNDSAIELLSPAFDLGVNNREVLARRPDYAEQIYSAGIVLVRAHNAENQTSSSDAIVQILARHFPSKTASASTVPPKIIKRIEDAKAKIAAAETTLELEGIGDGNCTSYLNGFPVDGPVSVEPELVYYVRHDCGRDRTPTWAVKVPAGQSLVVPVLSGPHSEFELASSSVRDRAKAERLMKALVFWADVDGMVAASTKGANETEVVVARWTPTGVSWSDGISSKNIQVALSKVFPELDSDQLASVESESSVERGDGPGIVPWIAIGGGTAIAGVGVLLYILAEGLNDEVECRILENNTRATDRDCTGVAAKQFTPEELDTANSRVTIQRIGAYSSWAIGAGAIAYGVYALLSHEPASETAQFGLSPLRGGAEATLTIQF